MDFLDRMLGHDYWATSQLLGHSRHLTDAQLDQEFDIGHRTLRETFNHMIYVINFWTELMTGYPVPAGREDRRSIPELIELHERYHPAFAALSRRVRDEQLLDDTFIDHYGYPQTLGSTIIQVFYHNTLHRSEARHILERLGVSNLRGDLDPQEWEHATRNI